MTSKTKDLILCAIFASILCVFSVMTIPIGAVPISMGLFGVMLTSIILGWRRGTIAVILYILIGAVGMPVFSGFKGGVAVLAGPTGGYITSYIFVSLIIGLLTKKLPQNKARAIALIVAVSFVGVLVCYTFGTIQFMFVQKMTLAKSLSVCVFPFIPFDIAKCLIAGFVGYGVRLGLTRSNVI